MVGRLVEHERVGSLPKRNGDLQLFALAMRELVEAPGHLVVQMKDLSQPPRFASIVEGKVCERVGWGVRFLGAEHAEEASRHAARVRLERANRNACERGLAATVVAQKAAPALWEGDIYVVQDGFRGARIGVAHVRKGNLHWHVFLVGRRARCHGTPGEPVWPRVAAPQCGCRLRAPNE